MTDSIAGEVRRLVNLFNARERFDHDDDRNQYADEAIANALHDYCGEWLALKKCNGDDPAELQIADVVIAYLDFCGYEIRKKQ